MLLRSRTRSISQTSYNSGDFSLVPQTQLNNINSLGGDLLRESVFPSKIHISQIFNVSAAAETVANRARPFLPRQKSRRTGRERFCHGRNHHAQGGNVSATAEIITYRAGTFLLRQKSRRTGRERFCSGRNHIGTFKNMFYQII